MKIGILGAGLAGIELDRRLKKKGIDFLIFEKEHHIGGLCRTMNYRDWHWDFGVHAIYSKNQKIIDYLLSLPIQYESHNRNVKICHRKNGNVYMLDYPFENGLRNLPLKDKFDCLFGYIGAKLKGKKQYFSLKEWIEDGLGFGMAQHFMIPYNQKIWNCELDMISMDLVSNKIEPASIWVVIKSCFGKRTVGRKYQAKFFYPKGGIGQLTKVLAEEILDKVRLNCKVEALRYDGKWRIYCDKKNNYEEADIIVSTIPLIELIKIVEPTIAKRPYHLLRHNDTLFFTVGLKEGKSFGRFKECHWVFFAQDEIFYRLTFMNNFSFMFAPCLVAEVTYKGEVKKSDLELLKSRVIKDLLRDEIISCEEDISIVEPYCYQYTYPIPTIGTEDLKNEIKKEFKNRNLFLLGRNGAWDYINMDGVIAKVEKFVQEFNF
jgi:protoporphyrinogen oxidase